MDILIVGIFLIMQIVFLMIALGWRAWVPALFSGLVGLLLLAQIAVDDKITYVSGSTTVTVSIGGFTLMVFLLPTVFCFMLMLMIRRS
jgi:hypothetical protein